MDFLDDGDESDMSEEAMAEVSEPLFRSGQAFAYHSRIAEAFGEEMSPSDFDGDLIIPGLYLGSVSGALNKEALKQREINHILTVARDLVTFPSMEVVDKDHLVQAHAVMAIWDLGSESVLDTLEEALLFMDKSLEKGNLLVHCAAGVSRSASVVIAYLMTRKHMSFVHALAHVRHARSVVWPNEGFLEQLKMLDHCKGDIALAKRAFEERKHLHSFTVTNNSA